MNEYTYLWRPVKYQREAEREKAEREKEGYTFLKAIRSGDGVWLIFRRLRLVIGGMK